MFFSRTRGWLACVGALALTFSSVQASDFVEPRGELTLNDAIAASLQRNPALQNAAFEIHAAEARVQQADIRPNPELGIEVENFAGSGSVKGTDALETTLTLSQVIELGGKRRNRVTAAQYERDSLDLERDAAQLDVLVEVARRFIDVAEEQEQLLLSRRATELADNTLKAISTRVDAARAPLAERSRATIARGKSSLEEQHATQALVGAHRRLAALWGSTDPQFRDVKTDLFALPAVAPFDELMARLQNNPDFLRFASEARLRDAQWQLAKAQAKSDVTVGAGLRRFEETDDTGLVVNFSMPLPLANPYRGSIREAAVRREQVDAEKQAAFISAQADLFTFYQSLQLARTEVSQLRSQLIPQAQAALEQTQDGYARGRFSYLELADTHRELIELQRAAISAAATYHRTLAEIERLTREPLAQVAN